MVLEHRAADLGLRKPFDDLEPGQQDRARSKYAGYVLGRLYLAGAFGADEDLAERRHNVLRDYADYHHRLYGPGTAQSTMRDLGSPRGRSPEGDADPLAGIYAKFKAWYSAILTLPGGRLVTHQVVERATIYEMPPATASELGCLIRAADRLIELRGDRPRDRRRGGRRGRRHHDLLAIYGREVFAPDPDELAEALAKFTALSGKTGSAD